MKDYLKAGAYTLLAVLPWAIPLMFTLSPDAHVSFVWLMVALVNAVSAISGTCALLHFYGRGPTVEGVIHSIGVWLTCRLLDRFHGSPEVQRHSDHLRINRLRELKRFVDYHEDCHNVINRYRQSKMDLHAETPGLRE